MLFWRRKQRRREPPSPPEPSGSMPTVGGFVGYTGRTLYGKQVVRVGDPELFRQEDAMRDRAQSALDPEDEPHAQTLINLLDRYADLEHSDRGATDAIDSEIRALGRRLCEDGGSNRMKLIAFRVAAMNQGNAYATVRSMESFWNGICGWQV
jgi:hypothetical protein